MTPSRRILTNALLSICVLAGLALLAWIGGELHYGNCLTSAELHYPVAYEPGKKPNAETENPFLEKSLSGSSPGAVAHFAFYHQAQRNQALAACSRWP